MPLNKTKLKADIKAAFVNAKAKDREPDAVFDALAGNISDAIDTYIKQMMITYSTGLIAPGGAVTGTFGYTIN